MLVFWSFWLLRPSLEPDPYDKATPYVYVVECDESNNVIGSGRMGYPELLYVIPRSNSKTRTH